MNIHQYQKKECRCEAAANQMKVSKKEDEQKIELKDNLPIAKVQRKLNRLMNDYTTKSVETTNNSTAINE